MEDIRKLKLNLNRAQKAINCFENLQWEFFTDFLQESIGSYNYYHRFLKKIIEEVEDPYLIGTFYSYVERCFQLEDKNCLFSIQMALYCFAKSMKSEFCYEKQCAAMRMFLLISDDENVLDIIASEMVKNGSFDTSKVKSQKEFIQFVKNYCYLLFMNNKDNSSLSAMDMMRLRSYISMDKVDYSKVNSENHLYEFCFNIFYENILEMIRKSKDEIKPIDITSFWCYRNSSNEAQSLFMNLFNLLIYIQKYDSGYWDEPDYWNNRILWESMEKALRFCWKKLGYGNYSDFSAASRLEPNEGYWEYTVHYREKLDNLLLTLKTNSPFSKYRKGTEITNKFINIFSKALNYQENNLDNLNYSGYLDSLDNIMVTKTDIQQLIGFVKDPRSWDILKYIDLPDQDQSDLSRIQETLYFAWEKFGFGSHFDFFEEGDSLLPYAIFESDVKRIIRSQIEILRKSSPFSVDKTTLLISILSELENKL